MDSLKLCKFVTVNNVRDSFVLVAWGCLLLFDAMATFGRRTCFNFLPRQWIEVIHGRSPSHELYLARATQKRAKIEGKEEIRKEAGWSTTFKTHKRPHCFKSVAVKSHWSTVVYKEKQSFWIHTRTRIPLRDGFRLLELLVLLSTAAAK
jgi:hypothetical protein